MEAESRNAGPNRRILRARRNGPMPFKPADRMVSSGKPACGTNFISIPRSVPTNSASLLASRLSHSRATASAGKTWPPVPPPAISSFKFLGSAGSPSAFLSSPLLADVEEHAGRQKHDEQAGATIAYKRQRDALRWHHPQHHAEIDERLGRHHHRDTHRQEAAEVVRGAKGGAQPTPGVGGKESQNDGASDEAEFLAQDRENEIGVRLGNIEELLLTLHQADSEKAARAHCDQRLDQLEAAALGIGIG